MNGYKNILVAVDDSKEAESALRKSIEIAKFVDDTTLHISNVIDTYSIAEDDFSTLEHEQLQSKKLLNNYKSIAEDEGIANVEVQIKHGSPQSVITDQLAPLVKADLIVCGVQGIKNAEHFFLGSVSEAVVLAATCDVLIVRSN